MPQFTIPVRFYVEYFYDRTNVSELKKEAKTPPDINLNSIYDLIRYGLMNPITSHQGNTEPACPDYRESRRDEAEVLERSLFDE